MNFYVPGRLPSIKTIVDMLGPMLHQNGKDPIAVAKAVRTAMSESRSSGEALRIIDKLIGGHGVEEAVQHPHGLPGRMGASFRYVNMGQTYAPTVIRYNSAWRVGDYGTLVETLERRGIRFE